MVKNEIIKRSPIRILEKTTRGGLGKGNIGVIAGKKGLGKTACLVHIATDQLFLGRHVIHLSYSGNIGHIVTWYEDIFQEIAKRYKLDCAMDVHDDIIKNRLVMNFKQADVSVEKIEKNIRALMENGNFSVETIVVDGYNFNKGSIEEFREFRRFARDNGFELWFSATITENASGSDRVPRMLLPYIDDIAILICLQPRGDFIHLNLVKDHDAEMASDMHLKLDPRILLIAEENQAERVV
jgi:predicted ATP-dependent serine protease